ncbi:helix-hairpin-helix domain-containing protein [Halopelagius fulvigenes]|uniref:Helix-hairpin-helix domain-containing protein n=1 Tax=Halopelagius fulvigenes TaxID=1198324 RepID=A0ABD5TYL3_9EURY
MTNSNDTTSDDLTTINGIGTKRAARLRAAGYETIADIQTAMVDDLARVEGISTHAAQTIVENTPAESSDTDTPDSGGLPAYECDYCGETFSSDEKAEYKEHKKTHPDTSDGKSAADVAAAGEFTSTGHDTVTSASNSNIRARLGRVTKHLRKRLPRDKDGDGRIEVRRSALIAWFLAAAFGTILGHTLAHDPNAMLKVVGGPSVVYATLRIIAQPNSTPIPKEWLDSTAFVLVIAGTLFGYSLVTVPYSEQFKMVSDALSHMVGEGHASGAH